MRLLPGARELQAANLGPLPNRLRQSSPEQLFGLRFPCCVEQHSSPVNNANSQIEFRGKGKVLPRVKCKTRHLFLLIHAILRAWEGRTDKRTRIVLSSFGDQQSTRSLPRTSPLLNMIKIEQFLLATDCTIALEGWTATGSDVSGGLASCCKDCPALRY